MKFKNSYYNYLFDYNGHFYIYNILSTAIAEINPNIYNSLINDDLIKISSEEKNGLQQQGFIVPESADEKNYYRYFYENTRFGSSAKVLGITFIPTYNCNLSCPYCYEGEEKSVEKIKKEDINKILGFISSQIKGSSEFVPISKLRILLFGGEPLLCKNELIYFCNATSNIAKKFNIDVEYSMVTNLTIVNSEIIDLIAKYKIITQVSIDGIKEDHDKRRIYKNGQGTYDTIISNLKTLLNNGLKNLVTIRINIDETNTKQADILFKTLKKYSDDIYFGILRSYKGINDNYKQNCFKGDCIDNISTEQLHDIYVNNGFEVPQKFGKKSPCGLNAQNKYIIDNKLNVYKCDLLINHPECRVGYINEDGKFFIEPNYYQQMAFSPFLFKDCLNCKFLPMCGAGCPAEKYLEIQLKNGDIIRKNCAFAEENLKNYLIDYIKRLA